MIFSPFILLLDEQRHIINEKDPSSVYKLQDIESASDRQIKLSKPNCLFTVQSDTIKLKDPNIDFCSISQCENSDELFNNINDKYEEAIANKPRRFLKRGDGLARFRMTFDDFKSPPNIYKEKKIKTYLSQKSEIGKKSVQAKAVKSLGDIPKCKSKFKSCSKTKVVPVNIYVPENKTKKTFPVKSTCNSIENKPTFCSKNRDVNPIPKAPVRNLILKPVTQNFSKSPTVGEPIAHEKPTENLQDLPRVSDRDRLEKHLQKDEKELRMFEMLEGKIDEGSLSPNSSLVARFMEESVCSTPSKFASSKDEAFSYLESLRALQRQYLTPEQINRIQEFDEEYISDESQISDVAANNFANLDIEEDKANDGSEKETEATGACEISEQEGVVPEERPNELTPLLPQSFKTNKTLLQEYIENFKKLKTEVKDNSSEFGCEDVEESTTAEVNAMDDQVLSQRDIALKLQRKALQDNVKNLLNWEGPSRNKQPKRQFKKLKSPRTEKSKKSEKIDDGKILLNSVVLKERLEELEREIEIFKRENRCLSQLQRDCEAEKSRLEKERKEFEKYMQQEKEKFEAKMSEEHKKLQRDKAVFDKYCKNIKNQPNKKEREEITNLKSEIERLNEAISTKDSRWGAAQARLRNQIKSLERENNEFKMEIEKLKKQAVKKVTFESEKNISTRIINAINSELGKLKPHIVNIGETKQKHESLTARVNTNMQKKPIRRIKSAPNLKKPSEKEASNAENSKESPSPAEADKENKPRFSFPADGKSEMKNHSMNKTELNERDPTIRGWLPAAKDSNSNDEEHNPLTSEDAKKKSDKC